MKSVKYPKILALGTPQISSIFDEPVEITEKLDGSQFGFGKIDGELICRSKGREIPPDSVDKLFKPAYDYVQTIADRIPNNTFFYGETLATPRHSTLAYERVPKNHIALFGVHDFAKNVLDDYTVIEGWAKALDVDVVPLLYSGMSNPEAVLEYFDKGSPKISYLGGQAIEGVVVKNYKTWIYVDMPVPVMAGKYVSEAFKEVHNKDWKTLNTSKGKFEGLKEKYRSEARWEKAVMRLKEAGVYTGTPKDIGAIISEVRADVVEECREMIMHDLYRLFADDVIRAAVLGVPQWFKEKILRESDAVQKS